MVFWCSFPLPPTSSHPSHCSEKTSFLQNGWSTFESGVFFLFWLERARLCGHYAGPENFIRPLSSENGPKQVFQYHNNYILLLPFLSKLRKEGKKQNVVIVVLENLFWTVLRAQRSDEIFRTSIMTAEASSFEPKQEEHSTFKCRPSILKKTSFFGAM